MGLFISREALNIMLYVALEKVLPFGGELRGSEEDGPFTLT